MRIRELLKSKGRDACTIAHELMVEDAIALMEKKKSSALIVMEEGRPVGILTEKDIVRCYIKSRSRPFGEIRVDSAMTNKLIVAQLEDEVASTTSVMIQAGIGHLPVMEDGRLVGMLSFRDLVQHQMAALAAEIDHLQEYIDNLHDAAKD